uniref:ZP domain-containing protein n=1 Tax=Parastrongyloides trichosuri TaxID=131310 RepID=A0A0N4ZJH9_PARTI
MFKVFIFLSFFIIEITYGRFVRSHMMNKVTCQGTFTVKFRANFTCNGEPFSPDRLDIYQNPALSITGGDVCKPDVPYKNGSFVDITYTGKAPSKNYKLYLKTTGTCNNKTTLKYNDFDDDNVGCSVNNAKTQDFGTITF